MPAPLFARCLTPVALHLLAPHADPLDEDTARDVVFDELHPGFLRPPPGVGVLPAGRPPGPPLPREIYGTPYPDHLESEHFTINWVAGDASREDAAAAADALELAWETFIEAGGWTEPVSSDRYFLWVMLDPALGGTGYTTVYTTDEYPEGYPVMYLNPDWAYDTAFWRSLAIHEFHHTVQFAMRPSYGSVDEDWYWEATAGWASLHAEPDSAAIDYTVAWYADDAHLDAATANAGHEYGMMAFNAYLEVIGDAGSPLRVWQGAADPRARWFDLLSAEVATPIDELIGAFGVQYANNTYSRTERWRDPELLDPAAGGEQQAERLGSRSYQAREDGSYAVEPVEGDVVMTDLSGPVSVVDLSAGDIFTVTATASGDARWRIVPADGATDGSDGADGADGTTDGAADGGGPADTSAPDGNDAGDGEAGDSEAEASGDDKGCGGCSHGAPGGAAVWAAAAALGLGLRRRRA